MQRPLRNNRCKTLPTAQTQCHNTRAMPTNFKNINKRMHNNCLAPSAPANKQECERTTQSAHAYNQKQHDKGGSAELAATTAEQRTRLRETRAQVGAHAIMSVEQEQYWSSHT